MKFFPLLLCSNAFGQRPLSAGYTVPRYRTRHVIKGKFFLVEIDIVNDYKGFETLADLNEMMAEMDASPLTEDSHFKTRYISMMLSWLMESKDHTAFENYGCHCKLNEVAERKPFVGYTKSNSGSKDEIDWFCAQHTTCHQCLTTQMNNWNGVFKSFPLKSSLMSSPNWNTHTQSNPKTTPYRFELGYRGDDRVIRCTGIEFDDQCGENLCQCDKRLAMALARRVDNIKEANNKLDSAQCSINAKQEQFKSCCGTVKTFPFK